MQDSRTASEGKHLDEESDDGDDGESGRSRVAFIGTGAVTAYHHLPGLRLDPRAELVAICDADPELLEKRQAEWSVAHRHDRSRGVCRLGRRRRRRDRHAQRHAPADRRGGGPGRQARHVREAARLSAVEVREMYEAARDAGVVHMTAFTYRFAPSMRYLRHLLKSGALGTPRHFRSQRFLDWPETSWGWRQYRVASRRGRPLRHDDPSHRLRHRPDGPDRAGLRRGRAVRAPRPDGRRHARALPPTSTTGRA